MVSSRRRLNAQAKWLIELAKAVTRELRELDVAHLALRGSLVLGEAMTDGWYVTLATLHPGGGTIAIFLDKTAGGRERRVWFGIWGRDLRRSRAVERAMGRTYGPTIVSRLESALTQRQLTHPIREPGGGKYGHYFGLYIREIPDTDRQPTSGQVSRIAKFCELVDGALGNTASRLIAPVTDDEGASSSAAGEVDPQKRIRTEILARRGQAQFRRALMKQFGGKCCVTGTTTRAVLEAAHIELVRRADINSVGNGLLLRSDIHTLFDVGRLAIDPQTHTVHVHPTIRKGEYGRYHRKPLQASTEAVGRIDRFALHKRWRSAAWAKRRTGERSAKVR